MKKKFTVTVAIAAYNAEKNISKLIYSLLDQESNTFIYESLIVNSDSSSDKTVDIANGIIDKRLKIIDSHYRNGFAGVIVNLLKKTYTDVLIVLNDDIIINDRYFLEKIVYSFLHDNHLGLACVNTQAMKSNSFVAESVRSGYNVYKNIGEHVREGNNVFTVDGKVLCFSKAFISKIRIPSDYSEMANVDKYIYFLCINSKMNYRYIKDAVIYFKCPSTANDFIKWQTRNYQTNNHVIPNKFKAIAEVEYKYPKHIFEYYKFMEFIKNPFGSVYILLLGYYCLYRSNKNKLSFNKTWDIVSTTKNI